METKHAEKVETGELEIAGKKIALGERVRIEFPAKQLYTHTDLSIPIEIIRGRPGPCVLMGGAVHGDEFNGVEIIRRVNASPVVKGLIGTIINKSRYLGKL